MNRNRNNRNSDRKKKQNGKKSNIDIKKTFSELIEGKFFQKKKKVISSKLHKKLKLQQHINYNKILPVNYYLLSNN